jgi:hypothetical protein
MGETRYPLLGRRFAVALIGTTIVVVALGWLTGLRHAMHGALLIGIATALLPFLVLGGLLVGLIVLAFVGGLVGAHDAPSASESATKDVAFFLGRCIRASTLKSDALEIGEQFSLAALAKICLVYASLVTLTHSPEIAGRAVVAVANDQAARLEKVETPMLEIPEAELRRIQMELDRSAARDRLRATAKDAQELISIVERLRESLGD